MHHDVGAPLDGPAKDGRGGGVVEHEGHAGGAGDGGDLLNGEDVEARVAQRLAVEELRVGPERAAERLGVFRVDERDLDPEPRQGVVEEVVGAAVEL
jgi:hypothetical protein